MTHHTESAEKQARKSKMVDGKSRAAIPTPIVTDVNAKRRLHWCHTHNTWSINKWKKVIWSDESSCKLSPTTGLVYVRRSSAQAYDIVIVYFQMSNMEVDRP
ncbi:DDE_3 domain-containing protein [Trichonephila clavipes]|nr:DDE_3 domain-containing protein [Trichonephila clavipes]